MFTSIFPLLFYLSRKVGQDAHIFVSENERNMIEQYKNTIKGIAEQMPDGFTFNPRRNTMQKGGYAVATIDTQDCIGNAGLFRVLKYCSKHPEYCIGGWCNENGQMQYDASIVFTNIADAIAAAVENKQKAIFNLYTGMAIPECEYYMYCTCVA